MRFSDIHGHENAITRLKAMADGGHLPHALLLTAPAGGVGEMMLARAFVQYLHCQHHTPDGDSCGVCPSCVQHASLNHVDLHFAFPVLKKGTVTLSDDWLPEWRKFLSTDPWMDLQEWTAMLGNANGQPRIYVHEAEALRRKMSYTAKTADLNIALIWLPEKMEEQAANKLLKLIEEPEEGTMFVMVSNAPGEILPTIYSRCQRLELKRLSDDVVTHLLMDNNGISETDAKAVAHNAEGNYIAARDSLKEATATKTYLEFFKQLMRLAYGRKVTDLKLWSEKVTELGRDSESRFLTYCQRMVRENFILNLQQTELNYLNAAESEFSARFYPFINERNVEQLIDEFNKARIDIEGNGNAKIILFDLAIKVIILLKA
jgi:DNA polymerase-3 subunit delta'